MPPRRWTISAIKRGPKALHGSAVYIHLYVEDVDAFTARAVAAGAKLTMPVADMFWGDRYGRLEDPFGHLWSVATHIRDVGRDEMRQAMAAMRQQRAATTSAATSATRAAAAVQTYCAYIKAPPQAIWDALTQPEWTLKYGYAPVVDYDLRVGGRFRAYPNEGMKQFPNIPDVITDGEILEVNAPAKLVQTWRMLMDPGLAAEGFTRLALELQPVRGGVTKLTVTHDLTGAPKLAALVAGQWESQGAGGGWHEIISGLKTLLETGAQLPFQSGPAQQCERAA